MKFNRMTEIQEALFQRVRDVRDSKGREYATEEDTLADFKEVAAELGVDPLTVWGTYVKKHQRAIDSFIRSGSTRSELIQDRIMDVITYHILLLGLVDDLENGDPERTSPIFKKAYPYPDGDIIVIGPGVFIGATEATSDVIHYRGRNFVPQPEPKAHVPMADLGADADPGPTALAPSGEGGRQCNAEYQIVWHDGIHHVDTVYCDQRPGHETLGTDHETAHPGGESYGRIEWPHKEALA